MSERDYLLAKSEMLRGVFRPLTKINVDYVKDATAPDGFKRVRTHVLDEAYAAALRTRLRGDPVFHGGDGRRIRRLTKGKDVDTTRGSGRFQSMGLLHTTTNKETAAHYAVAGRTPEAMRRDSKGMNQRVIPRAPRGKVAIFNPKGVFPTALAKDPQKGHLELMYDQKDLKGRLIGVEGSRRTRVKDLDRLHRSPQVTKSFGLAPIAKSFIDGKWQPITAVPKKKLKRAVKRGTFGQFHLTGIGEMKNAALHATGIGEELRRDMATVSPKVKVRNAYTKRKMDVISEGMLPGPHVNWATKPGQRTQIRLANKRTMAEIEPYARKQAGRGAPMSSEPSMINLHEHAHGTLKRPAPSRDAAVLNRAWTRHPDLVSRTAAANAKLAGAPDGGLKGATAGAKVGYNATKLSQKVALVNASRNLGEEARADVMASRKAGRKMVSGHVFDMGSPERYVRRRRTIERGMGVAQSSMSDVRPDTGIKARLRRSSLGKPAPSQINALLNEG